MQEYIMLGIKFGLGLGAIAFCSGYAINQCLRLFKAIANK